LADPEHLAEARLRAAGIPVKGSKKEVFMGIPKQAQERGDEADRLLKEQVEGSEGKTKEGEDLKLVPAPTDDKGTQADEESTPDKDKPTDQDQPVQDDFEQKYKVLKGKYDKEVNADVEALQERIKVAEQSSGDLNARVSELTNLLSLVQEKKTAPKPKKVKDELIEAKSFLSAEEIAKYEDAGYDESDLNILTLLAHRSAQKSVEPIKSGMEKMAQSTAISETDRFWDGFNKAFPNKEELHNEPEFNKFMASKAPYLNGTRQQVLEAAAKRLDLDTVVEVYNDYLKIRKKPAATPKPKLGNQLEPGGGAGGEIPVEGKIYTPTEIKKFYDDQVKGFYRNNPEEATRIDKDILLAQVQGRIKP